VAGLGYGVNCLGGGGGVFMKKVPRGKMTGTDAAAYTREAPGMSAFALEDGLVYHTYSAYARGLDALWGCTSGSIAHQRDVTRLGRGSAAATNTTRAKT